MTVHALPVVEPGPFATSCEHHEILPGRPSARDAAYRFGWVYSAAGGASPSSWTYLCRACAVALAVRLLELEVG